MIAERNEVPFRSMRELAKRAGVPPVTLVRIAQRLGFSGFEAFREVYVDAFVNGEGQQPQPRRRTRGPCAKKRFDRFCSSVRRARARTAARDDRTLNDRTLNATVKAIAGAERVVVMGRRTFFAAAFSLAYSLRKIKPGTLLLDTGGGAGLELDGLCGKDVFIGFSSHPYSRVTLGAARNAEATRRGDGRDHRQRERADCAIGRPRLPDEGQELRLSRLDCRRMPDRQHPGRSDRLGAWRGCARAYSSQRAADPGFGEYVIEHTRRK